jgi:hypothetical protein
VQQHYTWEAVSDRWATLYRDLTSARERSPIATPERNPSQDAAALVQEASAR